MLSIISNSCIPSFYGYNGFFIKESINRKIKLRAMIEPFTESIYRKLFFYNQDSLEELYTDYINIIESSLKFNRDTISYQYIIFYREISFDHIESNFFSEYTFIFENNYYHKELLKKIIDDIFGYTFEDDYFTQDEFINYLKNWNSIILKEHSKITEENIYSNIGKIPKRLKEKKWKV